MAEIRLLFNSSQLTFAERETQKKIQKIKPQTPPKIIVCTVIQFFDQSAHSLCQKYEILFCLVCKQGCLVRTRFL